MPSDLADPLRRETKSPSPKKQPIPPVCLYFASQTMEKQMKLVSGNTTKYLMVIIPEI